MALVMFFLVDMYSSSFSTILLSISCQLELTQVRQEIDRRMVEKDEEYMSTKKNMTKAIENMQSAVESESKAKAEALRMKKKLETDVLDLESNLER